MWGLKILPYTDGVQKSYPTLMGVTKSDHILMCGVTKSCPTDVGWGGFTKSYPTQMCVGGGC